MDDDHIVSIAVQKGYLSEEQVALAKEKLLALGNRGVQTSVYNILLESGELDHEDTWAIRKSISSSSLQPLEIEGYVIQSRVGSGGMGDVFKAVNAEGHTAAVKLLSARYCTSAEHIRRFEREVRAAMRLDHPHIAKIYDSGTTNGSHYILMELIEGETLKTWIATRGPLSEAHALVLLQQMASTLEYSWSCGVLHRDIKPANIILSTARPGIDEPFCAKLIDFGLAKVWQANGAKDESQGGLTGAGLALGTPHYMSPEQASGQQDLDLRCDIYGLGASLYHALLGHTMFSGKNSEVIMFKQVTEEIDLGELRRLHIRNDVILLLSQMLVKNRARRIGTWAAVTTAITRIYEAKASEAARLPSAQQPTDCAPVPKPASRDDAVQRTAPSTASAKPEPAPVFANPRRQLGSPATYLFGLIGIMLIGLVLWLLW